jgi:hypothetical protein
MYPNTAPSPASSLRQRLARLSMLALACFGLACGEEEEPCPTGWAGCACSSAGQCSFELTCQPAFNQPGKMVCRPKGASAGDPDAGVRPGATAR